METPPRRASRENSSTRRGNRFTQVGNALDVEVVYAWPRTADEVYFVATLAEDGTSAAVRLRAGVAVDAVSVAWFFSGANYTVTPRGTCALAARGVSCGAAADGEILAVITFTAAITTLEGFVFDETAETTPSLVPRYVARWCEAACETGFLDACRGEAPSSPRRASRRCALVSSVRHRTPSLPGPRRRLRRGTARAATAARGTASRSPACGKRTLSAPPARPSKAATGAKICLVLASTRVNSNIETLGAVVHCLGDPEATANVTDVLSAFISRRLSSEDAHHPNQARSRGLTTTSSYLVVDFDIQSTLDVAEVRSCAGINPSTRVEDASSVRLEVVETYSTRSFALHTGGHRHASGRTG